MGSDGAGVEEVAVVLVGLSRVEVGDPLEDVGVVPVVVVRDGDEVGVEIDVGLGV